MPRIEIEFDFDMVFCFGIRLALYAVFSTWIYLQHIARPVESDRPINIVFVRPSVLNRIRCTDEVWFKLKMIFLALCIIHP